MKRILLILSIIGFTTVQANAQAKSGPGPNGSGQTTLLRSYPNPATTVISFDFQQAHEKGYSLEIYSMLGRKMLEQNNIGDRTTVNLTDFTRGVFIYKLYDRNRRVVETGKFQVSK